MNHNSGIYAIIHRDSGKFYIGSAAHLRQRWIDHRKCLRSGTHCNAKLQRAWNKYGEEAFEFAPLLTCAKAELIAREQEAIDTLDPFYNILRTAGSSLGYKHTEEGRRRISLAMAGKIRGPYPPERNAPAIAACTGVPKSEEAKRKMSESHKGAVASEETRQKMRVAHTGHTHSQEARERMGRIKQERAAERRANGTIHRPDKAQRAFLSALTGARPRDSKGRLLKVQQVIATQQHEALTIDQEAS